MSANHCNQEDRHLKPATAQQGRRYVERRGRKIKCTQVYAHACARVWVDQWHINTQGLKVFSATAKVQVWKSEWHKNATAQKRTLRVVLGLKPANLFGCSTTCMCFDDSLNPHMHRTKTMSSGHQAVKYFNIGTKCSSMHEQWLEQGDCACFYEGTSGVSWHLLL